MGGRMCGHMHPWKGRAGMMHKMAWLHRWEHLDLSDAQKEQLRQILFNTKKEMIRRWAEVRVAKLELKQMLMEDAPDRMLVEQAVRNIGQKKTEMGLLMANAKLDALAVLTPEQRRELHEISPHTECPEYGHKGGLAGALGEEDEEEMGEA